MENINKSAVKLGIKKAIAFTGTDAVNIVFSFLLGRVVLFDSMSPFALAFLAAYANNNPDNMIRGTLIALSALLGAFSTGMGISLIKYLLAFILFGLVFTAVSTLTDKRNNFATSAIGMIALAVSGIIFIGQWQSSVYYILMLVIECVICFCVGAASGRSLKIIAQPKTVKDISPDAVIGLFALGAFSVLGFADLSIGSLSIGKALAGVYIMVIAASGGVGGGSAGGIGIGFLYSFAMYPAAESIGVFGICGMLCGYLSRYKRIGVIVGYVIANLMLTAFYGVSNGGVLSILDIMAAVIIFCLVPKSVILYMENIINSSLPADRSAKKAIEQITERITAITESVSDIANSFSETFLGKVPDNTNDIMLIYDKTADKVCRRCGLKFVCWEREFNSTYDQMLHLTPVLKTNGVVTMSDVPKEFRTKCVKIELFINMLNKLYTRYKLDTIWMKKVEAGKQLVSQHLYGFAEIMENFANDTKKQLDFVPNPDNILYLALHRYGIKCSDTCVIKTERGQFEVTVRAVTKENPNETERKIVDITSQTMGRRFYVKSHEQSSDKKRITVRMVEREKFNVTTGGAVRTKDGSESCGDSYCQHRLEHNRHLAILSDGMGSGANARQQSNYAVNVMLRLLNSGFDKNSAIKIMNLSLFLRQNEESFATVDAAVIDLFEGNAEFIKIGAASSYIKRGKQIRKVSSNSLPAGMLTDISPCTEKVGIKNGDIIVLLSDGVVGKDGDWIENYLTEADETNPQKLAESIVREAVIREDHTVKDDMTVITLLIDEEIA